MPCEEGRNEGESGQTSKERSKKCVSGSDVWWQERHVLDVLVAPAAWEAGLAKQHTTTHSHIVQHTHTSWKTLTCLEVSQDLGGWELVGDGVGVV